MQGLRSAFLASARELPTLTGQFTVMTTLRVTTNADQCRICPRSFPRTDGDSISSFRLGLIEHLVGTSKKQAGSVAMIGEDGYSC